MQCNFGDPCTQDNPVQPDPKLQMSSALERTVWVAGGWTCLRQCAAMIFRLFHTRQQLDHPTATDSASPPTCNLLHAVLHVPGPPSFWHSSNTQRSPVRASSYRPRIVIGQAPLL